MKVGLRRLVAIMIACAVILSYIPINGYTYVAHAEDAVINIINSDFSSEFF